MENRGLASLKKIAVLIPTYNRADRLAGIVKNFHDTTSQGRLYFVITPDDTHSQHILDELDQTYFIVNGEYREAINTAFILTKEPYIFCGADDIEFTAEWDKKLLTSIKGKGVTGGVDDWPISQSKVHISHPMVSRAYILEQGGAMGYPGLIYNPQMDHYQVDIELEQLAWSRDLITINHDCIIPHHHYVNRQATNDATYERSRQKLAHDTAVYERIKHKFEYWDTDSLHHGIAKELQHRKKLTVVMPIWNCEDYTRKTLTSLINKTQHKFELILIDDASTEHDGEALLAELKAEASQHFLLVKTLANTSQLFCNANWNKGVEMATGDYIAIINSDIEFLTQDWDDYLIENMDFGYELVSPFQRDRVYPDPYMKPPHEDAIYHLNLRGACFMVSKRFAEVAFPIPKELKHWCGDNWISLKAKTFMYDIRVEIYHHLSKSGAKVDQRQFWDMVSEDVDNFIKMTGSTELASVKHNCGMQVRRLHGHYHSA